MAEAGRGTVSPHVNASFQFCLPNCLALFQLLYQCRKAQVFRVMSVFPHRDMLATDLVPVVVVQRSIGIDWASVNCSQLFGR